MDELNEPVPAGPAPERHPLRFGDLGTFEAFKFLETELAEARAELAAATARFAAEQAADCPSCAQMRQWYGLVEPPRRPGRTRRNAMTLHLDPNRLCAECDQPLVREWLVYWHPTPAARELRAVRPRDPGQPGPVRQAGGRDLIE